MLVCPHSSSSSSSSSSSTSSSSSFSASFSFYFNSRIRETQRERRDGRDLTSTDSQPQMITMARTWLGQSQEPGILSEYSMLTAGAKALGPSSTATSGHLQGAGSEMEQSKPKLLPLLWDTNTASDSLTHCTTTLTTLPAAVTQVKSLASD